MTTAPTTEGSCRQALAQRYLVQSLRLSQASRDAKLGAYVLAGMSDQTRMLGHPQESLQLATAGRHRLARAYSPTCAADLWALQARAHAALGESSKAAHAVVESEAAFEQVHRDEEPEWARFIDTAYLAGEWANVFGDITRPRCTKAITDLRARIQPFHTVAVARDFDERSRLALAAMRTTREWRCG